MSRRYANPPITEVVCEFEFTDDTEWDSAIPGLIYAKDCESQKKFPLREQRSKRFIRFSSPRKPSSEVKPSVKKEEVTVFLAQDRDTFAQMRERSLSINQMGAYTSWDDFRKNIEYLFNISKQVINFEALQRIELRFVNMITIPEKTIKIEDYFEIWPHLGGNLPQELDSFMIGCIFPYSEGRDICKVRLIDTMPERENAVSFLLDIDCFLVKPRSVPTNGTLEWVERAHDKTEEIFEGCISDPLRKLFNEVK